MLNKLIEELKAIDGVVLIEIINGILHVEVEDASYFPAVKAVLDKQFDQVDELPNLASRMNPHAN